MDRLRHQVQPPGAAGPTLRRRSLLRFLVVGGGAMLLEACGASQQQQQTTPVAPASSTATVSATSSGPVSSASVTPPPAQVGTLNPSAAPKTGGILKQGFPADLQGFDPQLKTNSNDAMWLGVYDRLTMYDDDLKPTPLLAESWDISSDARTIKLNLRKGVTFHTGREFTSDDVKYTVLRTADPKVAAGQYAGMAAWFTGVDTPDKYTAILKSESPRPTVFDLLEFLNIGDKDTLEGPNAKTTAVGTGPFTFVEWVPGDHITLARNKNYWQSGKPYLDEIQIPVYRDQTSMVAALEAGAIDVARMPSIPDFNRLKKDSTYQASLNPLTGMHYQAGFNVTKPPFDNKKVRQALNFAIDRQRFVDTILGGIGQAESLPWLPSQPAYDATKNNAYTFDMDKAKALLNETGVTSLEFDYLPIPVNNETKGFGEIIQADYAKLGLKMTFRNYDIATWIDQIFNHKYFGVYFTGGSYYNLSPSTAFTNGKAFNPDPAQNASAYTSDTYVQLISAAASETDPAKQKVIYGQLNDLILDESFVTVVSPSPQSTLVAKANVQGLVWTAHENPEYLTTWLA